ncbi:MAG: 1-acyl-sn-glycerol-3-phosphate acyltransferase [Pseudomonadota bacterium]|nr:1-acyl-sn-glycerol-3-phosphate acyltransferase [Pseudomonadota bacterium]
MNRTGRSVLAVWRLLRCAVHALHGVLIVLTRFRAYDAAQRLGAIQWWAAKVLEVMGIGLRVQGQLQEGGVLLVANHVSWLDINALHAVLPQLRFVSKSDIRDWPLLSRLADAAGTLYLERDRKRDALRVVHLVAQALRQGQKVAVFPEGTTSDGRALLPFHANLLQAAIASGAPVQPIALRFSDAHAAVSAATLYVGSTTLVESMWRVAVADGLVAHVSILPARNSAGADRRTLARDLQADIAACVGGHPSQCRPAGLAAAEA